MRIALKSIDIVKEIVEIHLPSSIELCSFVDVPGTWDNPRNYHEITQFNQIFKIREDLLNESFLRNSGGHWELAISSPVKMRDGTRLHIPCIDFRTRPHEDGLALCRKALVSVVAKGISKALPGYILFSGQSYHYIGLQLLTEEEFYSLIGFCLLCEDGKDPARFSPIDRRWLGHSLVRRKFLLRIFASPTRPEPYVVEYVGK